MVELFGNYAGDDGKVLSYLQDLFGATLYKIGITANKLYW
ncbi:hypothetical protein NIES19_49240 [Anabaena cylindrica PCC 7122]|nr:hypothetical protein NIES19_49240 [Anabaena cylindrica PCC 7122]